MREQAKVWKAIQMGQFLSSGPKEYYGPKMQLEQNCGANEVDDEIQNGESENAEVGPKISKKCSWAGGRRCINSSNKEDNNAFID